MKSAEKIRLLVVDDHLIFRVGLIESIHTEPNISVIAEAATGPQSLEAYRQHRPDVTIMDLRLPLMTGVEATIAIRKEFPDARIIILSSYEGDEDIYRALNAGASGYLLKTVSQEELIGAIRKVHRGESYMPEHVASRLAQRQSRPDLSSRELQTLEMLVKGKTNKEIGAALFIAEVTVKVHLRHLFQKLNVNDRTSAVTAAIQSGIVHLD
jgi:DNA-binding NarL/FixJ family response regulator